MSLPNCEADMRIVLFSLVHHCTIKQAESPPDASRPLQDGRAHDGQSGSVSDGVEGFRRKAEASAAQGEEAGGVARGGPPPTRMVQVNKNDNNCPRSCLDEKYAASPRLEL